MIPVFRCSSVRPPVRTVPVTVAWLVLGSVLALGTLMADVDAAHAADGSLTRTRTLVHPVSGVYTVTGTDEAYSTPAIADVTGDGRPEIVVASLDGTVEALRMSDGSRIWSTSVGRTAIQASPVIADLDGDGAPDVVIGTMDGRILWLDGPTGHIVRTWHQLEPLHCPPGTDCRPDGFFATPTVVDLNGDGVLDIVAPSWDHTVYAWSSSGPLLWRTYLEDTLWSSPVAADIDGDGRVELVLGGDIWPDNPLAVPEGGLMWVLRHDGSVYPGYPRAVPTQTVWSSPAVYDLDGDGHLDVVVGTGTHFGHPAGQWVDAFTLTTRASLAGWPVAVEGRAMGSPAIGDLNGDGRPEVAISTEGGYVYAFDVSGRRLWRSCTATNCREGYATHGSVSIADIDGDGRQEVLSTLEHDLIVHDGATGQAEQRIRLSSSVAVNPASTPTVAEVDGTARVAVSYFYEQSTRVELFDTGRSLCRADWPTFQRTPRRTGVHRADHLGWVPFECPQEFVAQQYRDFLGRDLDPTGARFWANRLRTASVGSHVIRSFMASSEFGKVIAPPIRLHLALHGTYPGSSGVVRSHGDAIRSGASLVSIADRMVSAGAIAGLDDRAFVTRVLSHTSDRSPTSDEVTAGLAHLRQSPSRGAFLAVRAEEATARLEAEVNVAMSYLGLLDRVPDRDGWAYWVAAARRGGLDRLVSGFHHSEEYRQRVR